MPEPTEEPPEEAGGRLQHVVAARRDSLERLRGKGIEPFALGFDKDADAADVVAEFGQIEPGAETGARRALAGRVVLLRRHGRVAFVVIRDRSGDLQLFLSEDTLPAKGWALMDELNLGDIVGASGEVVRTKRGELSLKADRLVLLTKSLRPPPEKWKGIQDPELKVRLRPVQLFSDPVYREIVSARARVLHAFREELDSRGFVEVETPVLHPTAGGAIARPFTTHHRALDVDLYLRIALELYLKRVLVGGLERLRGKGIEPFALGFDKDGSTTWDGSSTWAGSGGGSPCWGRCPRPWAGRSRRRAGPSWSTWHSSTTSIPSRPGVRGSSSWSCSRSSWSTRCGSPRS